VIFSLYGNLAKLLNYRQLCIDFFKFLVFNATFNNISAIHKPNSGLDLGKKTEDPKSKRKEEKKNKS
jgi:hypothetical protein